MYNKESGVTLLEWLISITISLLVLSFCMRMYQILYQTTRVIENQSSSATDTEIISSLLTKDIRMAGFMMYPHRIESPLLAVDKDFSDSIRGIVKGEVIDSSALQEGLYLQYADPHRISILQASHDAIQCKSGVSFPKDSWLLIIDSEHAEVVQWGNIKLRHHYSSDATISELHRFFYYLAPITVSPHQKTITYAMHRKNLNNKELPSAVIHSVKKVVWRYGVWVDTQPIQYYTADQITNWKAVCAVQFTIELAYPADITPIRTKQLQTTSSTHVIEETVFLRNRTAYRI